MKQLDRESGHGRLARPPAARPHPGQTPSSRAKSRDLVFRVPCGKVVAANTRQHRGRARLQPCHQVPDSVQAPQEATANPRNLSLVILRQRSRARKRATPNEGSLHLLLRKVRRFALHRSVEGHGFSRAAKSPIPFRPRRDQHSSNPPSSHKSEILLTSIFLGG